jgi:hypothetical protein
MISPDEPHEVLVIGGGQACQALGYYLREMPFTFRQ